MICLESPSFDALVDPLNVQNDLAFLTDILAIEALTAFMMRVNCDRSKSQFQHWIGGGGEQTHRGCTERRYNWARPCPHDSGIKRETGVISSELEYMRSHF